MVTLAQEGQPAFRDRVELAWRHRASRPNALWQADHTELDVLVLEANGTAVRLRLLRNLGLVSGHPVRQEHHLQPVAVLSPAP